MIPVTHGVIPAAHGVIPAAGDMNRIARKGGNLLLSFTMHNLCVFFYVIIFKYL